MYIMKNALKNLARNKGRNMLVGILLFFMLTALCVSVVIESASQKLSGVYIDRFDITATFKVDYQSLIQSSVNFNLDVPELSTEDFKNYANSSYVKDCITFGANGMYSPDLTAVGAGSESSSLGALQINGGDRGEKYYTSNLSMYGYSDIMQLTDFIEGSRKITEGKVFSALNECIVSKDLADKNNLKVGDTFKVMTVEKAKSQTLSLVISGIYTDAVQSNGQFVISTAQIRSNDVLMSIDTMAQLSSSEYSIDGSFVLSDPNALEAFEDELSKKGLPKAYYISSNVNDYNKIVAPAEGLSQIVRVFMIVVLILGSGILLLLSLITIRERKFEIGILRAKGMSKGKIAAQFLCENFALMFICLTAALTVGSFMAQPVSDMLLENELTKIEQQEKDKSDSIDNIFSMELDESPAFGKNAEDAQMITSIETDLTASNISTLVLLSMLLCILASVTGVVYISKNEPMRILMERS